MALLDYICQLIFRKVTGAEIMYKSDEESSKNEEYNANENDVEDES
jgi:hypothetical protein